MSTTDYSSSSKTNIRTDIDQNFYIGKSKFEFPNGDVYEGGYAAHRNGLVWREGAGTYTTKDGQIYTGQWYNDKLIEKSEVEIIFPDGSQYRGPLEQNAFAGPALYSINEHLNLLCNFVKNRPVGEVLLLDINGRLWRGSAELDDCLLLPEHVYFNELPDDYGKGQLSKKMRDIKDKEPVNMISQMTQSLSSNAMPKITKVVSKAATTDKDVSHLHSIRQLEAKIFAKTKKTISDLRFEDLEWYQNYVKFKEHYKNICKKIKEEGLKNLNQEEAEWYENFILFKKRYFEIMFKRKHKEKSLLEYDLFTLYNSRKYKTYPIKVFYPTKVEESDSVGEEGNAEETYGDIQNICDEENKLKSKTNTSINIKH